MGHSNGGAMAISYAERYAACCRKLLLIDSQLIGFSGSEMTGKFLTNGMEDPRYREAVPHAGLPLPDTAGAFTERLHNLMPLRLPRDGLRPPACGHQRVEAGGL